MTVMTLTALEQRVREESPDDAMRRYRDCVESGHVWQPLHAPELTAREANYCPGCLRVKVGEQEFLPCAPSGGRS